MGLEEEELIERKEALVGVNRPMNFKYE